MIQYRHSLDAFNFRPETPALYEAWNPQIGPLPYSSGRFEGDRPQQHVSTHVKQRLGTSVRQQHAKADLGKRTLLPREHGVAQIS